MVRHTANGISTNQQRATDGGEMFCDMSLSIAMSTDPGGGGLAYSTYQVVWLRQL